MDNTQTYNPHVMPQPLRPAELRRFSANFANFPHDRGFLAAALSEPDATVYVDDLQSPRMVLLPGESTPVSFVSGDPATAHIVVDKLLELGHRNPCGLSPSRSCDEVGRGADRTMPTAGCSPSRDDR